MSFFIVLKNAGWREVQKAVIYHKGNWQIVFDTSCWMEVGTKHNPRVFDVPVPSPPLEQWTLNLIAHLCETDDRLRRARNA